MPRQRLLWGAPPHGNARRQRVVSVWKGLYRRRAAVEREFGRLKNEWALAPLRVRGLDPFGYTPT